MKYKALEAGSGMLRPIEPDSPQQPLPQFESSSPSTVTIHNRRGRIPKLSLNKRPGDKELEQTSVSIQHVIKSLMC